MPNPPLIRALRRQIARWVPPLCAVLAVLLPAAARAQVNIEPLRKSLSGHGMTTMIEGALTGRTGNTQGLEAVGAGGFAVASDPHLAFFYLSGDYARFNGSTSVQKSFGHVRYNYAFTPWLAGEVFAQAQTDAFQRLSLRRLVGLGPRFTLYHSAPIDVFYGTALMHEVGTIAAAPGTTDAGLLIAERWSNYLVLGYQPNARMSLLSTIYLQPELDRFANYRALFESAFAVTLNKTLAVKVSASIRYDSRPPQTVLPTDTEIKPSLTATF